MENSDSSLTDPLISIVMPVYNAQKYLEQCLISVINQSYVNFELIAIDDGSVDTSGIILEKFADSDDRIRIIHQQNQGVSFARNNGFNHANGEFVMFIDSDDWIDTNTCEKAVDAIRRTGADVVLWPYIREYSHSSKMTQYFGSKEKAWTKGYEKMLWRRMIGPVKEELSSPQILDSIITVWGKLYRRQLLEGEKFVDLSIVGTEDTLYNIQVFEKVKSAVYIPDILYHYRKSDLNTLTRTYKFDKINQWNELFRRITEILDSNNVSDDFYEALDNRICLGLIGLGLNLAEDRTLNFSQKRRELKRILNLPKYKEALKRLSLGYFPIHWRCFFLFAKYQMVILLSLYLWLINRLRSI